MPPPPPNFEPGEGGWIPARDETLPNDQGQISPFVDISDQEPVVANENTTVPTNGEPPSIDGDTSPANSLLSELSLSASSPLGRTIVVDVEPTDDWKKTCRKVVSLTEEYTGQDSLRIRIADQALVMDFPNQKTHLCPALMTAIEKTPAVCGVEVA